MSESNDNYSKNSSPCDNKDMSSSSSYESDTEKNPPAAKSNREEHVPTLVSKKDENKNPCTQSFIGECFNRDQVFCKNTIKKFHKHKENHKQKERASMECS